MKNRDQTAHGQVLRSEVEVFKVKLQEMAEELNLTKDLNKKLKDENTLLSDENVLLKEKNKEIDKEIYEKIQTLESKKQEVATYCNEKEASCKSLEQNSRDKVLKLIQTEQLYHDTIGVQRKEIDTNSQLLSYQEHDIKSNELTLEDIHVKIQQSKGELRSIEGVKQARLTELDKQIKDKSTELITLSSLVEQEKLKISKPMELLDKANQEINQATRDLRIAQSQIAQRWEKVFPGTKYIYVNI